MQSGTFLVYRRSGKFGMRGPALALLAAIAAGFPVGYAYAYLTRWIPWIVLRVFATAGYGFLFGLHTAALMKFGKVRNTSLAALCGAGTGAIALYFAWNGHVHATFKDRPVLSSLGQILAGLKVLFEQGSWSLRGVNITGIPLAIVWAVEGLLITGLSTLTAAGMVSDTPFCEKNQCWLDQEKKIDTLEAFTDPTQLEAFKAGNLGPLTLAKPRALGSATFGRLTLKHSPRCDEFCRARVANVTVSTDKRGKTREKTQTLTQTLVLPKSIFDLIAKFEGFKPAAPVIGG